MNEVRLDRIQERIDAGRIDAGMQITPKELIRAGLVTRIGDGIKLIGHGKDDVRTAIDIVVARASAGAIQSIEAAGGTVVTRYFTKQSTRALLRGHAACSTTPLPTGPEHVDAVLAHARSAPFRYRLPDPTSRREIEYYRDPAHRGYLSHTLQPGESPSLFFKVPTPLKIRYPKKPEKEGQKKVDDPEMFKMRNNLVV